MTKKTKKELIAGAEEARKVKKIHCGVNAANNVRIARKILEQRVVGKQND